METTEIKTENNSELSFKGKYREIIFTKFYDGDLMIEINDDQKLHIVLDSDKIEILLNWLTKVKS